MGKKLGIPGYENVVAHKSDIDMTNEEKATAIRNKLGIYADAYYGAMAMARWKDKQHEQEKQKLIDEACKWLFVNDSYAIPTNVQVDRLREHLNNIK